MNADHSERPATGALTRLVAAHAPLVLLVTAALLAVAGWRISKLTLNTDFAELLPASDSAVVVLKEMQKRMTSLSSLDVVVQGPDATANRRFVDELARRLRALHDPVIDEVTTGVHDEQAFFEHNKYLYAPLADLEDARTRIAETSATRRSPLFANLDDQDPRQPSPLATIERRIADENHRFDKFPDNYFAYPDGSLYAVVIWLRSGFLEAGPGEHAADVIRKATLALAAERHDPTMKVGLTGNVITAAEEKNALENDLKMATAISVALVCLVVLLYFRRLTAVPFMVVPALCGVAFALAFAQLAFGFVNTATGFMGAIIVGNGINYAIVQMARYEEERRRGRAVLEAIDVALKSTWRGTGTAALAAALAYGSLAITDFRGFNQFGWIGGVGMLLSWLATLLVLPSLWVIFDRRGSAIVAPTLGGIRFARPLARLVLGHPRAVLAIGGAVTLLAILPLPKYLRDPFEYDFDKLRNQVSKHSDSEVLSGKLGPIFGRSLSPSFVLADRAEQVPEIRATLRARDESRHVLGEVRAIEDFLPGTPAVQQQKLKLLDDIRKLIDKNVNLVDDEEAATLRRLRPPDDLAVLAPTALPSGIRRFYTEADGTMGRIVAYFARQDINVWDGRVQLKLSEVVRDVKLVDGSRVRSSGWAVIFAAMLDAVIHDGPIVTLVSFAAVLALMLLLARRTGAWLIVGSLCVGVLWMVGGVAAAGVRINFLNFIALPITFGIAADYGANVYLRYQQDGVASLENVVAATGSAVALCSLTTIIGYGALLVADTEGLRSFGAAAILGELACITTAVILLPAAIVLLERRRASRIAAVASDPDIVKEVAR